MHGWRSSEDLFTLISSPRLFDDVVAEVERQFFFFSLFFFTPNSSVLQLEWCIAVGVDNCSDGATIETDRSDRQNDDTSLVSTRFRFLFNS